MVGSLLSADECMAIAPNVQASGAAGGSRSLLSAAWCRSLAVRLREHTLLRHLIPHGHRAVQCTYFEKTAAANWLVPVHQDLSIPVAERVDAPNLGGWSEKEGAVFVHAPVEVLEQLVAVRLHIDRCTAADGALKVVPGSHLSGVLSPQTASEARRSTGEVVCEGDPGSALVMRPLLLHSSSKTQGAGRRRVLHFVYGPRLLTLGLRWQVAD